MVEVGHGDGSFLATLAERRPSGRYIGFDPNGAASGGGGVELRQELFDPMRHLEELRPDLVLSRHVLEHLVNPLGFLQRLAFAAARHGEPVLAYLEVPCIDRAIASRRTVDFYYEHSSQFTTRSFSQMLANCAAEIDEIGHAYDGEVIFGLLRFAGAPTALATAAQAATFHKVAEGALATIRDQLAELSASGRRVAVWGGTGKSAAFMCRYGMDAERFPLVVDSDAAKVGTFVPGTGQEIHSRDRLAGEPVDVLIIPPQWRAADILLEMDGHGIRVSTVLIEHGGRLVDFHTGEHPYSRHVPVPRP